MASLKQIAEKCGVSIATVSKALNGHSDISEATKQVVRETANDMGYYPNSAARALKTNRTYNLGVVYCDIPISHEYFSNVLESFKTEAEDHGYDVTFINHNIGAQPTTFYEHCRYRGVDGAAIINANFTDPEILDLVNNDLPVAVLDYMYDNKLSILSDNTEGSRALVEYVYNAGHRDLAYIHGEQTSVTEKRLTSFHKTCYDLGLEVPDEYVREGRYHDPEGTAEITRELLELPRRPSCIIFQDDYSYIGGMGVIYEYGLSIPDDISVVGYDGISLSQMLTPKLTTYRQNTEMLGKKAAENLISLIEKPKTTLKGKVLVRGELIEGESVRKL